MEGLAAVLAGPPAGHTVDDRIVAYLDGQGTVDIDTHLLHSACLRYCARDAVEDVAVFAVRLGEPLADDADYDIIRNELTGVHIALGLQSYLRTGFHSGAEDVSSGDRRYTQLAAEYFCLSTFTCAGGA